MPLKVSNVDIFNSLCDTSEAESKKLLANHQWVIEEAMSSQKMDDVDVKINALCNIVRSSPDSALIDEVASKIQSSNAWQKHLIHLFCSARPDFNIVTIISNILKNKMPKHALAKVSSFSKVENVFDGLIRENQISLGLTSQAKLGSKTLLVNFDSPLDSWILGQVTETSDDTTIVQVTNAKDVKNYSYIMPPMVVFFDVEV